jgi:hypothetical protein
MVSHADKRRNNHNNGTPHGFHFMEPEHYERKKAVAN